MIEFSRDLMIFLHRDAVDIRKSIDGLSQVVQAEMGKSAFDRALFVFCNKRRDRIKVLYWDNTGFCIWFKRLERELFPWPRKDKESVITITHQQMHWLFDGYHHWRTLPHQQLSYKMML